MPFRTPFLCRICEDRAANLLILHTCAGDVQGVNKIFIYIIQILSREFESLRARHHSSELRTFGGYLPFDVLVRTPDRQQAEFDKSPQAIWSPAGRVNHMEVIENKIKKSAKIACAGSV
jgi:hypothetical protein